MGALECAAGVYSHLMKPLRADLHTHTTCSDGSTSPAALIDLALQRGLGGLSITDHDTVAAYAEAGPAAKRAGLPLIPGCELSAEHKGESIHILAYAFPLDHPELLEFCELHRERRVRRAEKILDKLRKLGHKLQLGDLERSDSAVVGRPHIAEALRRLGAVGSVKEAFQLYLGEGRPAYVHGQPFSVEETLALIRKIGGISVIAHPHLIRHQRILREVLEQPFDGIECYYAIMPPERERRWLEMAEQKGWLVTGGSDYHGEVKPHIQVGSSWTPEESFLKLQQHYAKHSS